MYVSLSLLFFLAFVSATSYDPSRFKDFLMLNRMKQCAGKPTQVQLPISYYVPTGYYDGIPLNQRVPPGGAATAPQRVPACNNEMVPPANLNAYTFETERFITTLGLNIYDGATWAMAISLLGEVTEARNYQSQITLGGSTCQFKDIRGDHPCAGVIVEGQCSDPNQSGVCGFCYGQSTSEAFQTAWTFREICDYWSLDGTIDARCPDLKHTWTWNDYKPVLGENSWANLIGPLQVALIQFGNINAIPLDDISFKIAGNFLQSLPIMVEPSTGGLYYAPKNTLQNATTDLGFNLSLENNVSLLGGLKALLYIFQTRNIFPNFIPIIQQLITGIEKFIQNAYSPTLGYFRQGGTVVSGTFQWNNEFAVDCQTWTMAQIGPKRVDSWFGVGTASRIWNTTKQLGGYNYVSWSNSADGLGFSLNSQDQAFSGEWTAGGINMLRVFSAELNEPSYAAEGAAMRDNIEFKLTEKQTIGGVSTTTIKYCNKRYWIPFGWWANPLDCIASTAWAVFLDLNWNPLHLGGAYSTTY